MLRSIPIDIWAAAAVALAVLLFELFDPAPAIFMAIYLGVCAYIVVRTFRGEID